MADFRRRAFDYFTAQGWSPHAAAALAGNAQWESGGDPKRSHDQGTGVGLFGFRDPQPGVGRRADLYAWANQRQLDPLNETTQLGFADHELQRGNEKSWGDKLKAATDLQSAQDALMGYLRPQGWTEKTPRAGHGYEGRLKLASELLGDGFTGNNPNLPPIEPTKDVAEAPDWKGPSGGLLSTPYGGGDYYGDDSPATPAETARGVALGDAALKLANQGTGLLSQSRYDALGRQGQGLLAQGSPQAQVAPMGQFQAPAMPQIAPSPIYRPQGILSVNPFQRRRGGLLG